MKSFWRNTVLFLSLIVIASAEVSLAQQTLRDVGFSGQFFFSHEYDFYDEYETNEFAIKRGYITFKDDLNEQLSIRFTQDITIDQQGDGAGDIELRLKYALLSYSMEDFGIFTSPNIEAGVVHRPWINFEQDVNDYRSQKPMILDQNNIISSADFGLQFETGIGKELDDKLQKGLNTNPAKYGSIALGIYNGGGYSSLEQNNNKVVEGRATVRPMPDRIPGFQASVLGAFGKGNIPESPDFRLLGSALTYESERINLVLQGFQSKGDAAGDFVDLNSGKPYRLDGWSSFIGVQPFQHPVHLTFRYDELYNKDLNHLVVKQWVTGLAYVFNNRSKIIADISQENRITISEQSTFTRFEVVLEVRF
ncbi:MAG: hypothetical protein WD053_09905 [Gracilimonas sp.]